MAKRKKERLKKEEALAKFLQECEVEQNKITKELKELENFCFEVCFEELEILRFFGFFGFF